MFEPGLFPFCIETVFLICRPEFVSFYVVIIFGVPDGRHFKSAYGKELVESLILNADQLSSELEKTEGERLAAQQNKAATLQGQIDLIQAHQVRQDQRINFAMAREAEEADARSNEG